MRVSSLEAVRRSVRSHGCSCVFSFDASDPVTRARTHRCHGSLPPPASSIATQHLRASLVGFRGCATRARTSLSGRSRQDASELAGLDRVASNRLACQKKAAQRLSRREGFARVSMQRSGRTVREIVFADRRVCRAQWLWSAVVVERVSGREKEKPPDGYPRAFACLGDRGDRSPEEDQSWCVPLSRRRRRLPQSFDSAHASASRWKRDVSNGLAVRKAGFIGGLGWNSWCSGSVETKALLRWARTLHPYFFDCKHFFSQVDERLDEWIGDSAVLPRANDACAQTMPYKRKRAAEAARESHRC